MLFIDIGPDSHALKVTPETETSQIVEYFTPREQGFVSETGIKSEEMLNKWMEAANSAGVDGVLLGGDIIDSPTDNNLSLLQTALGTLTIPYLYTLGNHDWTFPWAYCNDVAKANYLPKFSAYFRNENPDFQVQDFDGFAIVALNNSSDQFTLEAAESFSNYLKTVGKPVIVMMHVPIHGENIQKTCEASWKRDISIGGIEITADDNSQKVIDLIEAKDSPVVAVLSGHIHALAQDELVKDTFETTTDAAYTGKGILLTIKPE